jgi:hypothetical protein
LYFALAVLLLGLTTLGVRIRSLSFASVAKPAAFEEIKSSNGYDFIRFDKARVRTDQAFYRRTDLVGSPCVPHDPRSLIAITTPDEITEAKEDLVGLAVSLAPTAPPKSVATWTKVLRRRNPRGLIAVSLGLGDRVDEVKSVRYVAGFPGARAPLFVLSPWYELDKGEDPGEAAFLAQSSYAGMIADRSTDKFFADELDAQKFPYKQEPVAVMVGPVPRSESVTRYMPIDGVQGVFVEVPDGVDFEAAAPEGIAYTAIGDSWETEPIRLYLLNKLRRSESPYPRIRAIALTSPASFVTRPGLPWKVHPMGVFFTLLGLGLLGMYLRSSSA